jgi:hypothetical protein
MIATRITNGRWLDGEDQILGVEAAAVRWCRSDETRLVIEKTTRP